MKAKYFIIVLIITLTAALCGCASNSNEANPISSSSSNGLFVLTITVDSAQYKNDTPITCYAQLKYTGTETITIYHSQPLTAFGVKDDKYFNNDYIRLDELISTTFNPGDEITYEFKKSGGWSQDEPNAAFYEKYYTQKELILPKGTYQLSANLQYSMDENDVAGTMQTLSAVVSIKVK